MRRLLIITALLCPTFLSAESKFDTGYLSECKTTKLCDPTGNCKSGLSIPKGQRSSQLFFLIKKGSKKRPFEAMLYDTGAGGFKEVKFNKDHSVGKYDGKFSNIVFKPRVNGEFRVETNLKGEDQTTVAYLKCGPKK